MFAVYCAGTFVRRKSLPRGLGYPTGWTNRAIFINTRIKNSNRI